MKYSTKQKEMKVFAAVMVLIMVALIVMMVLTICGVFDEPAWKPVAEYPIANQHITWSWAGRK